MQVSGVEAVIDAAVHIVQPSLLHRRSNFQSGPIHSAAVVRRPYSLARTAQPPPTAASVATAAKVAAMPTSIGCAAKEGLAYARENERQYRQYTGTDNRQRNAEIGKDEKEHKSISQASGRVKSHGNAVHAVSQPRRLWTVVEDVAEMAATTAAVNFGTHNAP